MSLSRERADEQPVDTEQVMLVEHRASTAPTRCAGSWQEIVNNVIGDLPIVVTWSPLRHNGIGFDRRVEGRAEAFGVRDALYRSALVMFDRRTTSLWPQPRGQAVLGPLRRWGLSGWSCCGRPGAPRRWRETTSATDGTWASQGL